MSQSPSTDAIVDKLSLTELKTFAATAVTTYTGATVDVGGAGPMPLSLAVLLAGIVCGTAGDALAITVHGSNDNFVADDVVVATFVAVDSTHVGAQRLSVSAQKRYYRAIGVSTSTGAFGGSETVRATVVLAGTDLYRAPYTAV